MPGRQGRMSGTPPPRSSPRRSHSPLTACPGPRRAPRWSATKGCVELVTERVQPTATRAANRKPPHNLAKRRRRVLDRPSDLSVTDAGVVAGRELAGLCLMNRRPMDVFRLVRGRQCVDVRGRRCVGRGASGSCGNRVADPACGCVSRPGKRAQLPCPLAPEREGPGALDRFARAGVRGSLGLEQRQHRSAQSAAQSAIRRRSSSLMVTWFTRTSCPFLCSLSLPTTPLAVPANPGASTRAQLQSKVPWRRRPSARAGHGRWQGGGRAFGACCFAGKLRSPAGFGVAAPSGGPLVRAACGGNHNLAWLPPRVVRHAQGHGMSHLRRRAGGQGTRPRPSPLSRYHSCWSVRCLTGPRAFSDRTARALAANSGKPTRTEGDDPWPSAPGPGLAVAFASRLLAGCC
jgi:hypothetical protein